MAKTIEERAEELAFQSYHDSIRGTIKNVYIYAATEQLKIDIEKAIAFMQEFNKRDFDCWEDFVDEFQKAMEEE